MGKVLLAAALVLLPALCAQAAPKPASPPSGGPVTSGNLYLCVGIFSFPLIPNVRKVANATSCVPKLEYLQTIDLTPPPPGASVTMVCETENTGGDGSFNIDALCPANNVALGGGYLCTTEPGLGGNPAPVTASVNTFFGAPTPTGWMTVGTANISGSSAGFGACRVCATCEPTGP
jgi:hypothetical protein